MERERERETSYYIADISRDGSEVGYTYRSHLSPGLLLPPSAILFPRPIVLFFSLLLAVTRPPFSFQFFFFFFFFSARFLPSSTYFPTTSSPFYTHTQTSTSDVKSFRSLSCCSCCLVPRSTPFHHSIYFFGPSYTVLYSSPFYWWLFGSCLLLFVYWLCYTGPSISFCLIYSY